MKRPLVRAVALSAVLSAALSAVHPPALQAQAAIAPDSQTVRFSVDGVNVIHRRTNTGLVVANLYLLGGVHLVTPASAGIEPLLLELSERGTRRYPGESLRRAMARTGSAIGVAAADDYTVFGLRTTTERVDSTWSIYADRLLAPTFVPSDFEFVQQSRIAALAQRADDADSQLEYLSDSVAFVGNAYALSPHGTDRSVASLTLDQVREFHRTQMVKSRMLLVIVGDLARERIERLVHGTLGTLPAGAYRWKVPAALGPRRGANVHIVSRRLPTNYILGQWSGPPAGDTDVPALRVATAVLQGMLFSEVRSRLNLTYAVEARFRDRGVTAGGLYVTTTRPDETLRVMKAQLRYLQNEPLRTEALGPLVQQFITEYFLDNETSGAQADFLARAELYRGDYRAGDRFVAELRAVTGEDIRRVVNAYMKDLRFTYIGNPSQVNRFALMGF